MPFTQPTSTVPFPWKLKEKSFFAPPPIEVACVNPSSAKERAPIPQRTARSRISITATTRSVCLFSRGCRFFTACFPRTLHAQLCAIAIGAHLSLSLFLSRKGGARYKTHSEGKAGTPEHPRSFFARYTATRAARLLLLSCAHLFSGVWLLTSGFSHRTAGTGRWV